MADNLKIATLQLRTSKKSPYPKLYVSNTLEGRDYILRSLPTALLISDKMTEEELGKFTWKIIESKIETMGKFAHSRKKSSERFKPSTDRFIGEYLMEFFDTTTINELHFVAPIFVRYVKWKRSEVRDTIIPKDEDAIVAPAFLREWQSQDAVKRILPDTAGPPMKIPSGEILPTCCEACTFNMDNLIGNCAFGTPECVHQCEFPNKTAMLKNIKNWMTEFEKMMADQ